VLLPNVNGVAVTFFGLLFHGITPVLLNFTSGVRNLRSACETAEIEVDRHLAALHRYGQARRGDHRHRRGAAGDLSGGCAQGHQHARQDFRADALEVRPLHRAQGLSGPDAPAVVLFTSGSEGAPKGVVLSHANIVGNARADLAARATAC
jgi:acyl-[acyl-carrier-protein]-phospholipid O-acyltransferase/long-chain-fatty-acid--[acyl-carrier-protein] ligase